MKALAAWVLLAALGCAAPAHAAIHVQRDAASGAVVYSNTPAGSRGNGVYNVVASLPAAVARPPAGFPVIAQAEQQRRDLDRRAILHEELGQEQQRLEQARALGAAPDIQQRHRSNIAALLREIAAVR